MCSTSVFSDGKLLGFRELNDGFTHAENLHVFIREILKTCGVTVKDLSAIAVSKGPGSYTGLRIGVSTAKGLAYALQIPLLAIDTLQLMAGQALEQVNEPAFYCPMIDARRMEVYTAIYDQDLGQKKQVEALIVTENSLDGFKDYSPIYFFGDGMSKCRDLLAGLPHAKFIDHIVPSAKYMGTLAFRKFNNRDFENVAYFEPSYLKDFLILKKSGN